MRRAVPNKSNRRLYDASHQSLPFSAFKLTQSDGGSAVTEKRIAILSTIAAIAIIALILNHRGMVLLYLCLTALLAYAIYKIALEIKNAKV